MFVSILTFSLLLILSSLPDVFSAAESPTAKLSGGILRGKYLISRDGRNYEAFLGVHFGTIPARFENSVLDTSTWEGVKEATEYGPACAQKFPMKQAEDCLYLNVFTPKADNQKRPVVVFIHGGGFTVGGSELYGAKYFMDEEVVLVTVTYRLGVLGFLSTGDGIVTGNMGLRDQIISLKWIQQNIEAFGGDPNRVTIFGESAGAASVNFLLLSPLTKGLFHNAVASSGTATSPWAFSENTLANTFAISEKVGCKTTGSMSELVACLRQIPTNQLLDAQSTLAKWFLDPVAPFSPTVEIRNAQNPEPFLDRKPIDILKSGDFNRVPVLLTVNKDEGIILHAAIVLRNEPIRQQLNDDWDRVAPITFYYGDVPAFSGHVSEISKELRQFYFGNAEITLENEHNLTNLYTDTWFLKGIHDTALHMAKHVPVFTGLFTHLRKDYSFTYFFGIKEILGVSHGDDLAFFFDGSEAYSRIGPAFVMTDVVEEDDVKASKIFVKIISSFAASGTPQVPLDNSSNWSSVTKDEVKSGQLNWFNIGLEPYLHVNPFKTRMDFWEKIFKKQGKNSSKTEL